MNGACIAVLRQTADVVFSPRFPPNRVLLCDASPVPGMAAATGLCDWSLPQGTAVARAI